MTPPTTLSLPYRPPYDWDALLAYLAARAMPGVEQVEGGAYRRTFALHSRVGRLEARHLPAEHRLSVDIVCPDATMLPDVARRLRRMFDVDCEPNRVHAALATCPMCAPLLRLRPGLRSPGAWDGFELAIRAVLGQQISVAGARTLALRLVLACGRAAVPAPHPTPAPLLTHVFPSARQVLDTDLGVLGMPSARRAALRALAEAAVADPSLFEATIGLEASVARLRQIPGIGDWTAHYIALRALREMDAFPASDLALLRAAAGPDGARPIPRTLLARAEAWRPWRAYAAQHLWAADQAARTLTLRMAKK